MRTEIQSVESVGFFELEGARVLNVFSHGKHQANCNTVFVAEGRHHRRGTNEQERPVEGCFAQQDRPLQVHKRRDTKRQGSKARRTRRSGEVGPEV